MVMPETPCCDRAFFTSSSLKWRMMASIFFMGAYVLHQIASPREASSRGSGENVAFFAGLGNVQAADFVLLAVAEANRGVHYLKYYERGDDSQGPRNRHGGDLTHDQPLAAFDEAEHVAVVDVGAGTRGK